MKLLLATIGLLFTMEGMSQKELFDTLKIDATTKIIGRYPQYDQNKTYEKFNFIIEDSNKIQEFIKKLKLGEEVANSIEDPSFELTVVKNYQEIGSWTINPTLNSALTHDGHTYKFDISQITDLNKKYPFRYSYEVKPFKTKDEYEIYLTQQKRKANFLFDYAPEFKYEGSFEIEFPINPKFSSPKAISDLLEPYIEKIVKKNDYSLGYKLDSKNINNRNQYTMSIQGPKILFEQLKFENLKNQNWQPIVEEAFFFYKK